jgi:hypothetical protein
MKVYIPVGLQHQVREHFGNCCAYCRTAETGRATIYALKINRPQMVRVRRMWVAMNEHPPNLD